MVAVFHFHFPVLRVQEVVEHTSDPTHVMTGRLKVVVLHHRIAQRRDIFTSQHFVTRLAVDDEIDSLSKDLRRKLGTIDVVECARDQIPCKEALPTVTRPCVWLIEGFGGVDGPQDLGIERFCV